MNATNPIRVPAPFAHKIRPRHLDRLAIVYVRQSTQQQVVGNRESADLQYQLRRRAIEYGWPGAAGAVARWWPATRTRSASPGTRATRATTRGPNGRARA